MLNLLSEIEWQTWMARLVVLITALWFVALMAKRLNTRNRPGCGSQCGGGKPAGFPRQTLSGLPIKKPNSNASSGRHYKRGACFRDAIMTPSGKGRFLNACFCEPTGRPPVWMMRQAGRALPEYRELRDRHSFLDLVRTPELAMEATLQPIRRFGFDAAVLFSDILVVNEALGQAYRFRDGGGIQMDWVPQNEKDFQRLNVVDVPGGAQGRAVLAGGRLCPSARPLRGAPPVLQALSSLRLDDSARESRR
jgi:hypothetical protein